MYEEDIEGEIPFTEKEKKYWSDIQNKMQEKKNNQWECSAYDSDDCENYDDCDGRECERANNHEENDGIIFVDFQRKEIIGHIPVDWHGEISKEDQELLLGYFLLLDLSTIEDVEEIFEKAA